MAERCQQLVMDGYQRGEDRFADSIAVDCLLKVAANKDAALQVMNQRPRDLESALDNYVENGSTQSGDNLLWNEAQGKGINRSGGF